MICQLFAGLPGGGGGPVPFVANDPKPQFSLCPEDGAPGGGAGPAGGSAKVQAVWKIRQIEIIIIRAIRKWNKFLLQEERKTQWSQ